MRHHSYPLGWQLKKKVKTENKCWHGYGETGNAYALLVGRQNGTTTVEHTKAVPQKIRNRIIIWSSKATSGYTPQKNWK